MACRLPQAPLRFACFDVSRQERAQQQALLAAQMAATGLNVAENNVAKCDVWSELICCLKHWLKYGSTVGYKSMVHSIQGGASRISIVGTRYLLFVSSAEVACPEQEMDPGMNWHGPRYGLLRAQCLLPSGGQVGGSC